MKLNAERVWFLGIVIPYFSLNKEVGSSLFSSTRWAGLD